MASQVWANQELRLRVNRYIEIRSVIGKVTYQQGKTARHAHVGMRLEKEGDRLMTDKNSHALLMLDTGIGFLEMSQQTNFTIKKLQTSKDGGKITDLKVTSGQLHLKLRSFEHSSSQLRIESPAGIAGVRGTEFGLTVSPIGRMGVATLRGSVATIAQKQTVYVNRGFQNFVIPGKPPSIPVPLRNNTELSISILEQIVNQRAHIKGKVDPVNSVAIENRPLISNEMGIFDINVPLAADRIVSVNVTTPLGKHQEYKLNVP